MGKNSVQKKENIEALPSSGLKNSLVKLGRIQLTVSNENLLGFSLLLNCLCSICNRKRKSTLSSLLSLLGLLINSDNLMLSLIDFEAVDLGTRGNCLW